MIRKKLEKLKISEKFNVLSLAILVFLFASVAISLIFINDVRVGGTAYRKITGFHYYLNSLGKLDLIFENQKDQINFYKKTRDPRYNVLHSEVVKELKAYIRRSSKAIVQNDFEGSLRSQNEKLSLLIEEYFLDLVDYKKYQSESKSEQNKYFDSLTEKIKTIQAVVYDTRILAAQSIKNSESKINSYVQITVGLIFVIFGLAFFSINSMARMIRGQIDTSLTYLLEGANKVAHGNFDHIIPIQTKDEFGTLAQSFNSMTNDLKRTTVHLDALIEEVQKSKKLESQLMYAQSMAALGEMAGGIAHEINNPLAVISANTNVLKMRLELDRIDPQDFSSRIEKIEKTVDRIGKIISGLRTFARDGSKDSYAWEPFEKILDDTFELCSEKMISMGIELRFATPESDIEVECSLTQLSQVFLNLLNNARDAVAECDEKWVSLDFEFSHNELTVKVCDSGDGIDPHILKKIFNPFYTTKKMGQGTGLGLSISKGIVESHGGSLEIDTLSERTCFVVKLPARRSSDSGSTAA
ncbi:MAG: HAMP domain-containing protein [Bdellovibrionales bacterium]|nr:HAMP domain-containing protein [Bdellovibrionales bacterium]